MATEDNGLEKLIKYCHAIVKGTVSTTRFATTVESHLPSKVADFCDAASNPFPKPQRMSKDFGTFDVDQVDAEASRM